MRNYKITGFADEIDPCFDTQLEVLNKLGVSYMEIRGADGNNISKHTMEEVAVLKEKLAKANVKISAIGSPIGKYNITDDFAPQFDLFKHVCDIAIALETRYIRMFSFHLPEGADKADYQDEVISRLAQFIEYAKTKDIVLLHENEKGIFGDTAESCVLLMEKLYCDNFKAIFDFANYLQCDQDTVETFKAMKKYVHYIHIKDCIGSDVVPAGMGDGKLDVILNELLSEGFDGFLSLEPHLQQFVGFAELEEDGESIKSEKKNDGKTMWWIALNSLKAILYNIDK